MAYKARLPYSKCEPPPAEQLARQGISEADWQEKVWEDWCIYAQLELTQGVYMEGEPNNDIECDPEWTDADKHGPAGCNFVFASKEDRDEAVRRWHAGFDYKNIFAFDD